VAGSYKLGGQEGKMESGACGAAREKKKENNPGPGGVHSELGSPACTFVISAPLFAFIGRYDRHRREWEKRKEWSSALYKGKLSSIHLRSSKKFLN